MKNLLFLVSLSMLVVACGPKPASEKPKIVKNDDSVIQMAPIYAELGESSFVLDSQSGILFSVGRNQYAAQPIVIKNNTSEDKPISVSFATLDSRVDKDGSCPSILKARRSCSIVLYFNRNHQQPIMTETSMGVVSLASGSVLGSVSVGAEVTGESAVEESETSLLINRTSVTVGPYVQSNSSTQVIVVKNSSAYDQTLIVDLGSQITGTGFSIENLCPAIILPRRVCVLVVTHTGASAVVGLNSADIEVAGKIVTLSAQVEADPVYSSNPNLTWDSNPANSLTLGAGQTNTLTWMITNESADNQAQSFLSKDFSFGVMTEYPAAFTTVNSCPTLMLIDRKCEVSLSFDPERFHYGIVFTKTANIKDEEVVIELTGDSPCNPDHSAKKSDAAYGTKLNAAKTACVPNLGVFDSPDSVFGHAVFQ